MNVPLRFPNVASPAYEPVPADGPHNAGFADAFGQRYRTVDSATATSLDVLRLTQEFSDSPEFEAALRAHVDDVSHLHHPSLAIIRSVERLDGRLSVVSQHTPGRRVSELASTACGPAFALDVVRQMTPALATLHREGVAHGTLSDERIVAAGDGRLVLVEHVLGSAIEALRLPRARLNQLGLAVSGGGDPVRFDGRTDMLQLGFIVLSLLLRRRLGAAGYPAAVPALLDEFVENAGSPVLAAKMRVWLERALQLSPESFASARDAQDAFDDLPTDEEVEVAESARALLAFPSEVPSDAPVSPGPEVASPPPAETAKPAKPGNTRVPSATVVVPPPARAPRRSRAAFWIIAALSLVAAGEAVVIVGLLFGRPPADLIEIRSAVPPAPAPIVPAALPPSAVPAPEPAAGVPIARSTAPASAPAKTGDVSPASSVTPGTTVPRFGGFAATSVIDLQVFKDGKLLGSTAGPIALSEGSHDLQFANEVLGFRHAQTVNVKSGQMTSFSIAVPNGRISINAAPWAEVLIDGNAAGETPIANFALPIGTHEIVFRHPTLGVRRQTVVVKVGVPLRVAETFK